MTGAELDALVAELQRSTPLSRLTTPGAARAVFLQLLALGYDLVKPQAGDKYNLVESDEELRNIIEYLQRETPLDRLSFTEARAVFNWISGKGLRIRKPDRHPSGLATTEQGITTVVPLSRGHARRVIVKGAPVGPISVFNGGESE